ncbi:laccase domain-containing protein [Auraticoccus sp. F435]|uniref:Laccase domain-containing protein n=1 Tax=Auraticoccus cholistanensis TaxID=2656650 RepID=A0A6A9V1J9_9ACTN|nr:laccase domain-containing protein [Auraticoccus cholistanensis]
MLRFTDSVDGVRVAFTDRHGGVTPGPRGSLDLGRTDLDPDGARENFTRLRRTLGLDRVVAMHQVHSARVHEVDLATARRWPEHGHLGDSVPGQPPLPVADALVAGDLREAGRVALCVRVADCLPVLLADPAARVVAAVHAGRVGLLAGVLPRALEALRRRGATAVRAWIGPHVCGRCYEVPEPMQQEAAATHPAAVARTSWGTPSLDLGAAAEQELGTLGVDVTRVGGCTRTDPDLHSHRRDGEASGRLAGLVWLE